MNSFDLAEAGEFDLDIRIEDNDAHTPLQPMSDEERARIAARNSQCCPSLCAFPAE
jgi:hypothetical protein